MINLYTSGTAVDMVDSRDFVIKLLSVFVLTLIEENNKGHEYCKRLSFSKLHRISRNRLYERNQVSYSFSSHGSAKNTDKNVSFKITL